MVWALDTNVQNEDTVRGIMGPLSISPEEDPDPRPPLSGTVLTRLELNLDHHNHPRSVLKPCCADEDIAKIGECAPLNLLSLVPPVSGKPVFATRSVA